MARRSPSRDDRPRRRAVVVACPRDERGRLDEERAVVSRTVVRVLTATGYRVVAFGVGRGRRAATPATVTAAIARAARAAAAGEVVVVYLACPAWSLRGSTILAVAASPRSRPPRARVRLPLAEVIAGLRQTEAATALFLDVGPAAATLDPGSVVATDAPSLARDERDGGFALLAADAAFAGGLRGPLIAALGGEAAEADGAVGFGAVAEEIQRAARAASAPRARAAPVVRLEIADLPLIPAPVRRALATPSPIRAVAFAPDGGRLAVGGDDGVVRRFEPRTGAAIDALPPLPAAVGGLAFDRAGRVLHVGGVDGTLAAWDLARRTSRPSRGLAIAPREVAWSDDRRRLAAPFAATTLGPGAGLAPDAVVDLSDPAVRAHLRAHLVIRHGLMVRVGSRDRELATDEHLPLVCAFAGAVLVSGGGDGRVLRWDVVGGGGRALTALPGPVWALATSPDGRWVAAGGVIVEPAPAQRYAVHVVGLTGRVRCAVSGHRAPIVAVAFAPDGRWLASASRDGELRLWDAVDGTPLRRFARTDSGSIAAAAPTALAWSPDGGQLAVGYDDGIGQIFEVGP
jgi:WD40 repeat protein